MLVALLLPFALKAQVSLPINMDFEDATAFGQWTMTNCQSSTGISSSEAHEGTNSFYFYFTSTPPQYLISPEFTATTGTEMVSFWYKATNTQWGNESFEVGFSSTTNEVTAFEWGTSVEVSNLTWAEYTAAIPEGTKYVAIKSTANDAYYLYIDDIYIGAPPACASITDLTVGGTTTSSISLNWTDDINDDATYTIYDMSDTSVIAEDIDEYTYTIEGLTDNTLYTFGVKASCGADGFSNGYVNISVRTECSAFEHPYTWNFENMAADETPSCWEKVGTGSVTVTTSNAHSGSKKLFFSNSTSNLIMLPPTEAEINTLQMKLWISPEGNYSNCANFSVGYVADGTFTALATYNYTDFLVNSTASYDVRAVMFTSAPEGARMALRAEPSSSNYYWYVDDVTIDELPSCFPVSGLTINAEETTPNSLTLTWQSDASNFIIIDMADGTERGTSDENSFEINDLNANTAYTFGVVVDCGGDYSDTITVSGRTACDVISTLPYSMGFEANDLQGTTNALSFPYCWTRINTLPSTSTYSYYPYSYQYITPHEGDRALYFSASSSWGTYADTTGFILPELDVNTYPMNGNRVTFWAKVTSSSSPYKVFVGTMSDPADMATFSLVDSVSVSSTSYEMKSVSLAEANEEDAYVAFLVPKVYSGMYIDDVTLEPMPTCMEVSNVNAIDSLTTPNSITITWVDTLNPAGTEYTIYNMADTTVIENIDIADNVAVIEGLNPNTVYTFGVQANCGDDDAHFITVSHRTSCAPMPLPFNETFGASITNSPCWAGASGITADEVLAGSTLTLSSPQWTYTSSSSNGIEGGHYFVNIYGTNCKKWMITPELNLSEAEQPLLTFDAAFTVYTYGSNAPATGFENNPTQAFKILVTTDGGQTWDLATNVSLTSIASSTYIPQFVNLSEYAGEEAVRIAFYAQSTEDGGDNNLHIDNILIEESTGEICYPVTDLAASDVTSESATLTWEGEANSYMLYTFTATDTTYDPVYENFIDLDELEANTTYSYGVTAVCDNGAESVMMTVTFTTPCNAVAIPFVEDFETNSPTVNCWNTANTASSTGLVTSGAYSGSRAFQFWYSTNPPQYLFSPELSGTENGLALSFMYKAGSDYYVESFQIGYSTTTNEIAAFTWGTEQIVSNTTYQQFSEILPPGTKYMAVKYTANNMFALNIDSVVFALPPSCIPVAGLNADDITGTSATLTWLGNADNYAVYAISDNDTTLEGTVPEASIELSGLEPNSVYTYGVTSICDNDEESDMVTFTFNTACEAVTLPYAETFESTSGTRNCWQLISNNTANPIIFTTYDNRPVLRFSSYTNASDYNQYGFSPLMETSGDATNLMVNIVYSTYGLNDLLKFGYVTETDTIWDETTYSSTLWDTYTAIIPATATQIAIHYYGNYKYYAWIDSISVVEIGDDYCYAVTDLTVDSITANSAFLSWTDDNNTGITYTIYNGTSEVATISATSYEVPDLESYTTYTFGVVANCSEDNSSDMVTVSATTECADITSLPYHEGFENGLGCWTTVNGSADGYPWFSTQGDEDLPAHGGNGMAASVSYYYGGINANAWLISPKIVLPTASSENGISLSWWQRVDQNYPLEHYDVMISTTSNDTAAFTTTLLAVTPDSTSDWIQNVVDLTAYAGQEVYLAFHHHDSYEQNYLLIDDIELFQGDYVPPTPDTLTVTFAVNDATMGTTIPAPGTYQYIEGDTVSFGSQANAGYHFAYWVLNDGTSIDTLDTHYANGYVVLVSSLLAQNIHAISFTAYFEAGNPDSTTITYAVNDPTMGTITPTPGTYTIYVGDNITTTATPNDGYVLSAWVFDTYLNGELINSDTTYSDDPEFENPMNFGSLPQLYADYEATITITALFEAGSAPTQYTVTLNTADATMGTVSPAGETTVEGGASFTATATAAEGYHFVAWMNGDAQVSIENPYTFTVTGNITLTATFEANDPVVTYYEVTVNSADLNMGTVTSTASGQVAENTEVTVTATPAEGYRFVAWMNGNDTVSTVNPYTFTVTGDITLTAIFDYEIGIDDFDFTNVNVYSTKSTIIVNGAENQDIFVYDMNGRCIYKHFNANETERINVLSAGAYLVRISNGVTKKVVVVK